MNNFEYISFFIFCIIFFINLSLLADTVKSFSNSADQKNYIKTNTCFWQDPMMNEQDANNKLTTQEEIVNWANGVGKRGLFVIAGQLVDDKNNLLDNVTVNIKKNASGFWNTKNSFSEHLASKYFVVIVEQCDSVDLSFCKSGYTSLNYYASYSLKQNKTLNKNRSLDNAIQYSNYVFADNQKVILLKRGELLKLKCFSGVLSFDEAKESNEIFLLKTWKKDVEKKTVQEPYFKISYTRDDQGKILRVKKEYGEQGSKLIPQSISFEMVSSDPKDGILEKENKSIPNGKILSAMGEAIDGKYVKSIQISFELDESEIFFFYFVDGRYGKGSYELNSSRIKLYQNNENDERKKRNLWTK